MMRQETTLPGVATATRLTKGNQVAIMADNRVKVFKTEKRTPIADTEEFLKDHGKFSLLLVHEPTDTVVAGSTSEKDSDALYDEFFRDFHAEKAREREYVVWQGPAAMTKAAKELQKRAASANESKAPSINK